MKYLTQSGAEVWLHSTPFKNPPEWIHLAPIISELHGLIMQILHRFDRYTKTMFLFLAVTGKWLFWQVTHVGLRDGNVAAWISNNGLFIGAGWYGSGIWCAIFPDATYKVNADYGFYYFRHLQAIIPALLEPSWINVNSVLLCWINVDSIMIKRYFWWGCLSYPLCHSVVKLSALLFDYFVFYTFAGAKFYS